MRKKSLNLPKQRIFTGPALIWKRIAAFAIDFFVIEFVLGFPFQSLIKRIMPTELSYSEAYSFFMNNSYYTKMLTALMIMFSVLAILYFAILEYKLGQTVGKILMNIKVVGEKKLGFWQCIGRSLFLIPAFPFFLLWVIDPLYLFFGKKGQRLSEVLTKTKVVENFIIN